MAAALDEIGGVLGTESFAANPDGYKALLEWIGGFGDGLQGGRGRHRRLWAGLGRFLARAGVEVIEVDRPNRQARRQEASPIPLDAVEAARAVLVGPGQWTAQDPRRQRSRPSGSWSWPSARPARPGSRPSTRCAS